MPFLASETKTYKTGEHPASQPQSSDSSTVATAPLVSADKLVGCPADRGVTCRYCTGGSMLGEV